MYQIQEIRLTVAFLLVPAIGKKIVETIASLIRRLFWVRNISSSSVPFHLLRICQKHAHIAIGGAGGFFGQLELKISLLLLFLPSLLLVGGFTNILGLREMWVQGA